jgi:hypothetical protein
MSANGKLKTKEPPGLRPLFWAIGFGVMILTLILAGAALKNGWAFIWGPFFGFVMLAMASPKVTLYMKGLEAAIIENTDGELRVIHSGLHFIYPTEVIFAIVDLHKNIVQVFGKKEPETYPTKDGLVLVKGTLIISPDVSDPNTADENIIKWARVAPPPTHKEGEPLGVVTAARGEMSRSFRDHFREQETETVVTGESAKAIQEELFRDPRKMDVAKNSGASVEVILEDIDRDPRLQKVRDTIGQAESQVEAIKAIKNALPSLTDKEAADFYETWNFPNVQKVKGFENATHVSIIPGAGFPSGGSQKKGGKP